MLHIDQHPIPKAEDLFVTLAGGKEFSEPNLSQADQQILLHLNDCKYTTINTHLGFLLGLWHCVCSSNFQHAMEKILHGIPRII